MAAKRFLDQDPEYEPIPMEIQEKRMKFIERDARTATIKKIESILRSTFGAAIGSKTKEVDVFDDMLYEGRQMIDRLRAQAVMKFFCEAGSKDTKHDESSIPSIHPTVKENLIGKAPKFSSLSESPVVKTEGPTLLSTSALSGTHQNTTLVTLTNNSSETEYSKSKPAVDDEIASRAPRMKTKCKIIVGNTSKFLLSAHRDEDDQSTHKWKVYVRGDKDNPDIDSFVKKVCFLLHSSYRPNDIVEVCNPPFQLTKRGWGEFVIRVQLHFKDPRNKPVDIFHHLKLDKTYTGLQTMGGETVAELVLFKTEDRKTPKLTSIQSMPVQSDISQTVLVNTVNKVTTTVPNISSIHNAVIKSNSSVVSVTVSPEEVKKERDKSCSSTNPPTIISPVKSSISPIKNAEIPKLQQPVQSPIKAAPHSSFTDKVRSSPAVSKRSPQSKPLRTLNQAAKNQITNGVGTFIKCTDSQGRILLVPQTSLICMSPVNNNAVVKPFTVTQTVVQPQCSSGTELGKNIIQAALPASPLPSNAKLPSYVLKVIPTVQSRPNQVLLIPVSESSQKAQTTSSNFIINNAVVNSNTSSQQQNSIFAAVTAHTPVKKTKPLLHWEQMMERLRVESYSSFVELLKKMMKIFPLISQEYDPASIPYCAPSVEVFQSWNIGKQRAAEWQRAGMVRRASLKFIETHNSCLKADDVWSRREIMVWCRKNGYTPSMHEKSSSAPMDSAHVGSSVNEIFTLTDSKILTAQVESQNIVVAADEDEEEIDIIGLNSEDGIKKQKTSHSHCSRDYIPSLSPAAHYVKETAAEIGVKLKPVELEPSVFMPVIEEMILAACKEFASDLIRASLMHGYHRVGGKLSPEEVIVQDVFCALQKTDTFDFITNKHLGVSQELLDQS